ADLAVWYGYRFVFAVNLQLERGHVVLGRQKTSSLKVTVIAGWFETRATELRCDVLGGDVQTSRWSIAAFERVRGDEGQVPAKRISRNAIEHGARIRSQRRLLRSQRDGADENDRCDER